MAELVWHLSTVGPARPGGLAPHPDNPHKLRCELVPEDEDGLGAQACRRSRCQACAARVAWHIAVAAHLLPTRGGKTRLRCHPAPRKLLRRSPARTGCEFDGRRCQAQRSAAYPRPRLLPDRMLNGRSSNRNGLSYSDRVRLRPGPARAATTVARWQNRLCRITRGGVPRPRPTFVSRPQPP